MIAKVQAAAGAIARRVLVHAASALTAIGLATSGAGASAFAAYIGLTCLVPGGFANRPQWLASVVTGLFGLGLCLVFGLPLTLSLFWGGLTTWLTRLILKKGHMGLAWLTSLFLVPISFHSLVNGTSPGLVPLGLMVAAVLLISAVQVKVISPRLDRRFLAAFTARLGNLRASGKLPDGLTAPVRELESLSRGYLALPALSLSGTVIDSLRELDAEMSRHERSLPNLEPFELRRLQTGLGNSRDLIAGEMDRLRPHNPDAAARGAMIGAGLEEFRDSAVLLLRKKDRLPPSMRADLDSLYASTENILECMVSDPADLAPGSRFLARYLPAAHNLADEYLRLGSDNSPYPDAQALAQRSAQTLTRLAEAFKSEHQRLLQNDLISLTAELNTLDKLLKMDGR